MYYVKKRYGHELGLSACFRQWRAKSHCRHLHGYPLSFELTFGSSVLNENNWVIDFGDLKWIKKLLEDTFDHRLVVAADDPYLDEITGLASLDIADTLILPHVGCEAFAKHIYTEVAATLLLAPQYDTVRLVSVECREHGGNAALYAGPSSPLTEPECV